MPTTIYIGLENNIEGRSLAWALDYPGCFAYGQDEGEAIVRFAPAFIAYADWVGRHAGGPAWLDGLRELDFRLAEVWNTYQIDERYRVVPQGEEINAWFRHDWQPLTAAEIERGLLLLRWARQDLLELVGELSPEKMAEKKDGERWSIAGILRHVAGAEWWYLDRLDLAGLPRAEVPDEPFERLAVIRARLETALPALAGRDDLVRGKAGEFWSPRKLLRRAIWHERDHWMHISRLVLEG
ncbi:MAG TPA: DinB family protein [Anaerolineaceae bacterium]|nr:DinB family protein [Anaerolineaceae bacterium]